MTTKTIILMRHGHIDNNRRLTDQGIQQVQSIANLLLKRRVIPDIVEHSPTQRTKRSAEICLEWFQANGKALNVQSRANRGLELEDIPMVIAFLPDKFDTALLVSHEPDIRECFNFFELTISGVSHANAYVLKTAAETWETVSRPNSIKASSLLLPALA